MYRSMVAVAFTLLLAGCGTKLPHLALPAQSGDAETLDAATGAAQEVADRQSSGDFAGVWLMMSKQVRNTISQADFVTRQNACTATVPIHVTGVRMEGTDEAIVRWNLDLPTLSGFKITQTMVYEDGKWAMQGDPESAPDYGQPVQQIIAKRKAAGHCAKTASSTTGATTTSLTPSPTPATSEMPTNGALQPGDGDGFFINEIRTVFTPPPEAAIRAIIPLAHQVCDARANGQDDLQAAHLVWVGKGVDTLGIAWGSTAGLEAAALDIAESATLAYCPQHNNGDW
jgi:predicted small lipoprotein YifL